MNCLGSDDVVHDVTTETVFSARSVPSIYGKPWTVQGDSSAVGGKR
jgi:hypothetical protein